MWQGWLVSHIGWLLVNIGIPGLAPLVAILVIKLFTLGHKEADPEKVWQRSISAPYHDGQLSYVALGWVAAAAYEVVNNAPKIGNLPVGVLGWGVAGFIVVFLGSAGCAAGGTIYPSRYNPKKDGKRALNTFVNYRFGFMSILLGIAAAGGFVAVYHVTEHVGG
jgi:hypothetical protein